MSRLRMFVSLGSGLAIALAIATEGAAQAAKGSWRSSAGYGNSDGNGGSAGGHGMMFDLSAHYVRETRTGGTTDSAVRMSIGGMFNDWVGLDLQGNLQIRSKSHLVGSNLRVTPTDWFFVKAGLGVYADKVTRQLKPTPLAGAGIVARLGRSYYFVTETSYFQVADQNNVSFGAGFGLVF